MRLDGVWEFYPGDHELTDLPALRAGEIVVPGLWEAQGHHELDGVAWYRTAFSIADAADCWTLRFGAVMDIAEVYLGDALLATHDAPFTPFEIDLTGRLQSGRNVLAVRVTDPAVSDREHPRLVHGKQGWANGDFPSPPSVYLTYGGIWQSVTLRRHGPVVLRDVFVNSDPDGLGVVAEVHNVGPAAVSAMVRTTAVGKAGEAAVMLAPGERREVTVALGATDATRWSPHNPVLHEALVEVTADGAPSDSRTLRVGLRTVRLDGARIFVNDEPYRMKSALVQGFYPGTLYREPAREQIVREVLLAQEAGFNTLRLHVKAFDPVYLDVCDELGMLLHCDIPIAEPIAHDELAATGLLADRCARAIVEQVRRDRNHPSIILWSTMNEICLDSVERGARRTPGYEAFARRMVATVVEQDPTRPVIENDWIEPDPDQVFASPLLTAHWYGRLDWSYLALLDERLGEWVDCGKAFLVTEFGDTGLPVMAERADPPFWWPGAHFASDIGSLPWPASAADFALETQRYQGLSNRLQGEVIRRHGHSAGYCLTELTDVPWELNGVVDFDRNPKPATLREVALLNQVRLPMLRVDSLTVVQGVDVTGLLTIANDGPSIEDATVVVELGSERVSIQIGRLAAHDLTEVGEISIRAPRSRGEHPLRLTLTEHGERAATNWYPIHVVDLPAAPGSVCFVGDTATGALLADLGGTLSADGLLVVGEQRLAADVAPLITARLSSGATVVVLAQDIDAARHYPVPVDLEPVTTGWGGVDYHFTTDTGALPSLPGCAVLATEDAALRPRVRISSIGGRRWPDVTAAGIYKPVPRAAQGLLVGAHRVGPGRLVVCQYRLSEPAARGDVAARSVLADVVCWGQSGGQPATPVRSRFPFTTL